MWARTPDAPVGQGEQSRATAEEIELARAADFRLGRMEVQPSTLQVVFSGQRRPMEPRVMQGLVALASARGQVVSRDRLVELCWAGRAISEDAINRCVAKLRKLGSESGAFEVETIPRVGYRLVEKDAAREASPPLSLKPLPLLLPALLILALAAGAFWYWHGSNHAPRPTIAVLPFAAIDSDPDTRNLAASISETISNALVQTGAQLPDGEIRSVDEARRSGAALIVSGTVRRDGTAVRVMARVDSPTAQSTILTNEFQAAIPDAQSLSGSVAAWLIPPVRMWASFLPTENNPRVTDGILRIFLTRSGFDTLRAWTLSRTLAASNPRSGSAQFVFALLTADVLAQIAPDQRRQAVADARAAALRAVSLLPRPARARTVLECFLTAPGWLVLTPTCDASMRAAISSDPDVPVLPYLFGSQLAQSGRFVEAAKMTDIDLAANPLGPGQLLQRIFVTKMMQSADADDVLPLLEARMDRYVGHNSTAYFDLRAAIANGEFGEAKAIMDEPQFAAESAGDRNMATVRVVIRAATTKSPDNVRAMTTSCKPVAPGAIPGDPALGACLAGLSALGDLDATFALADRAYHDVECCSAARQEDQWLQTGGDYYPRWELFGKAMAPARADRRFIEVARRTGLLAYWKSGHPPDFCAFERVPVCAAIGRQPALTSP